MYISIFFVQDLLYFNLYKQLEFQDLWNILHLFQAKFMETISAISWQSVLLVEETGVGTQRKHRPATQVIDKLYHRLIIF
jgi:hypothetical protein